MRMKGKPQWDWHREAAREQRDFLINVLLRDVFIVVWLWVIIWLVAYIYL
jgi:hypothetical protein